MNTFPVHLPQTLATVAELKGGPQFLDIHGNVVETGNLSPKIAQEPYSLKRMKRTLLEREEQLAPSIPPLDVAEELTEVAVLEGPVVDPACGGGIFLLSAAKRLAALGGIKEVARNQIFGSDMR